MANTRTYLQLTNFVLNELNEVELTSSNFSSSRGVQTSTKNFINKAMIIVAEDSKVNHESFYETTVANQRYYELPKGVLEISRVTLSDGDGKDYSIPRSSTPFIEDTDLT